MRQLITLILALTATFACSAETGTALKNDSLRAEPYGDAKTTGTLNRGDKLDILTKQGAWLKVKAAKSTGWVRLLSVKRGDMAGSSAGSEATGVLNVASGRSGTGQIVATTGVRGLNEEELKSAQFNPEELDALERFSSSPEQARQFAAEANLSPRKLAYLPAPKGGVK